MKTTVVIFLSVMLAIPPALYAALPAKSVEERIADLEKEIQLLKRQREVEREDQHNKEAETSFAVAGKDGFIIKTRDSDFQLKIRGQIQSDVRFYANDDTSAGSNTFVPRRIRPILEGTVWKYFDFRLMPILGAERPAFKMLMSISSIGRRLRSRSESSRSL